MKFRSVLQVAVCAASLAAPIAFGGPRGGPRINPMTHTQNYAYAAGQIGCDGINPICAYFYVDTSEGGPLGRVGQVSVGYLTDSTAQTFYCFGEAYADALQYDPSTSRFTIKVTLDPFKDPNCGRNFDEIIVLNISGAPSGTSTDVSTGAGLITTGTSRTKYKFQHEVVEGVATGTNGYFNATYPSLLDAIQRTDRVKVD